MLRSMAIAKYFPLKNFVTDGGLTVYLHRERYVGGILDLYSIFMEQLS